MVGVGIGGKEGTDESPPGSPTVVLVSIGVWESPEPGSRAKSKAVSREWLKFTSVSSGR